MENWTNISLDHFMKHLGECWLDMGASDPVYRMKVERNHLNPLKFTHGGLLSAFLDATMGDACFRACDERHCFTLSLTTNFVATSHLGEMIFSKPIITKRTAHLCYATATVTNEKDRMIATACGVWKPIKKSLTKRIYYREQKN